ncbi:glycosyltransferase [Cryobacterium sp. Y82]|uniref:glycosyltransferase n=1 Tax=Cryobacterium sp. Y82 TaxID=2045017 RepID=UPI001E5402BB|nr:glycosyltransferase [Cryobacterium sp. Y82]
MNYTTKVIYEMHEFPELLALKGHDVTFFHYPELPTVPHRSVRSTKVKITGRAYPEAEIQLVTPATFGGSPAERYLAPLLGLPALRSEIRHGAYDVIVLYSVPTTGWQTVRIAAGAGVPVVFRALDVSHQIRSSPVSRLIRLAEKYIYKNATLLSANNPAMADYCVEVSGRTGATVVNVPPIDLSHFADAVVGDLRDELGLRAENKVVLYMGSFFSFSGLDIVLEKMAEEFARHPLLRLVLVGGGDLDEKLRARSRELGIADQVIFTGVVPYARLPAYLKVADVAINPFVPQLLTNVAFPHKVLQYMASEIPTVSTSLTGLRGVLGDDSGVTWVDQPHDVTAAAIELAFSSQDVRQKVADRQREFISSNFSKETAIASFERALEGVL